MFHPAEKRGLKVGMLLDSVRAVATIDQGEREEEGNHSERGEDEAG